MGQHRPPISEEHPGPRRALCRTHGQANGVVALPQELSLVPTLGAAENIFLGMTLSRTGRPTVVGTLVGLGIVGVLNNGLNIMQVNGYIQQILTGLIIILAVSLSRISKRRPA